MDLFKLTNAVFVFQTSDFIYPFRSVRNICRVLGRRYWPVSRCKPRFTSTTTTRTRRMESVRRRPGPPTFSAARWKARRTVAQEDRAEASWHTQGREPEARVAVMVRVCSLAVTLRRVPCAPHPNKWGLPPTPDLPHVLFQKSLCLDTLRCPGWTGAGDCCDCLWPTLHSRMARPQLSLFLLVTLVQGSHIKR